MSRKLSKDDIQAAAIQKGVHVEDLTSDQLENIKYERDMTESQSKQNEQDELDKSNEFCPETE